MICRGVQSDEKETRRDGAQSGKKLFELHPPLQTTADKGRHGGGGEVLESSDEKAM